MTRGARKQLSGSLVEELAEQAQHVCALCGGLVARDDRSVDHIVPLSCGGSDDRANLQLAHKRCNVARGNAPFERDRRRTATDLIAGAMSEDRLQRNVLQVARLLDWACYHTWNSQHSQPGWPDLAICRPPRLLLVELKTETGKVKPAQARWRSLLSACSGVEYHLWRPSDWLSGRIEEALQ